MADSTADSQAAADNAEHTTRPLADQSHPAVDSALGELSLHPSPASTPNTSWGDASAAAAVGSGLQPSQSPHRTSYGRQFHRGKPSYGPGHWVYIYNLPPFFTWMTFKSFLRSRSVVDHIDKVHVVPGQGSVRARSEADLAAVLAALDSATWAPYAPDPLVYATEYSDGPPVRALPRHAVPAAFSSPVYSPPPQFFQPAAGAAPAAPLSPIVGHYSPTYQYLDPAAIAGGIPGGIPGGSPAGDASVPPSSMANGVPMQGTLSPGTLSPNGLPNGLPMMLPGGIDPQYQYQQFIGYYEPPQSWPMRAPYQQRRPHIPRAMATEKQRLFISNIPFNTQWQDLKDHLRNAGEISHVEIRQFPDGRSRGCAHAVFATEQDAANAIQKFDNTMFENRRISVRYDSYYPARNRASGRPAPGDGDAQKPDISPQSPAEQ